MSIISDLVINQTNNVVSLENLEDVPENFLLRAPKRGKLIKGPNWTAYKKENLCTIPRKIEKVLIEDKHMTTRGFSSQSERFSGRNQSEKYEFPGPGTYQNVQDTFNTTSTSFSSKGYGNGFISSSIRFDDPKVYYDQFLPGPGHYKVDEKVSITSEVDKNINYKYLYHKSNIKSLKVKKDFPGPGFYNPIMSEVEKTKWPLSAFQSRVNRFNKEEIGSDVPGPGKYFKEKNNPKIPDNKNIEDQKMFKGNTLSYFFKLPSPKKENLNKYIEKNHQENLPEYKLHKNSDCDTQIVQNIKHVMQNEQLKIKTHTSFGNYTKNKFNHTHFTNSQISTGYFPKSSKSLEATKKEFLMTLNSKMRNNRQRKKVISSQRSQASPNFQLKQNAIIETRNVQTISDNLKEALYLKEILGKNQKRPLFELSPPRWSDLISSHNPGPAYYKPQLVPDKVDFFNDNLSRWI